jgi:hypothetical protein
MPQLGTIFPGTPARFLHAKAEHAASSVGRPTYSTIILFWRKFICDKSVSGMLINPSIAFPFQAKGGVVPPLVHI